MQGRTDTTEPLAIAVIASARHPISEPFAGGLEAQTHALAAGLRARGHRVTVFASEQSDPRLGVEPVCPPTYSLGLSAAARADESMPADGFLEEHHAYLSLMLRLAGERFDLVHNNSLHYLPVAMAELVDAPVLTTLHTPPTPWLESALASRRRAPNARWAAVSAATAAQWRHVADAEVIHNGIDLVRWHPDRGRTPRRGAVWTGRLVPEKGPHHAIDAAARAGIPLTLAGPAPDPDYFERELAPRLEPYSGTGAKWAGHLGGATLSRIVASARVAVVSPCWEEPFGLVVAEALASGTPVAAWERGALAELLADERCGRLAEPGDVDALAAAIAEAAELDPRHCRERAERSLGRDAMVAAYERLYTRLVHAGRDS